MRTGRAIAFDSLGRCVGMPLVLTAALAAQEKSLRPEVQQLVQSVGEKLQAAADKLGLTAEQRTKIREIDAGQAEQRTALRAERRNLLQEELKSLAAILTPEQREKIKEYAEDKMEPAEQGARRGCRDSLPRGTRWPNGRTRRPRSWV